jgi:hypothetical protein
MTDEQRAHLTAHLARIGRYPFVCDLCGGHEWHATLVAALCVTERSAEHHIALTCCGCAQARLFNAAATLPGYAERASSALDAPHA